MTKSPIGVRRVVVVVLDGFRPEFVDQLGLGHIRRLAYGGAWTVRAESALPSVTTRALFRDVAEHITQGLGIPGARFVGRDSQLTLTAAESTLATQRRGLILMHWPDAEHAIDDHGLGSDRVHDAARRLDRSLGDLATSIEVPRDPGTVLMVASDHVKVSDDRPHQVFSGDRELLLLAGARVAQSPLPKTVSILDVAPTVLWLLGLGSSTSRGVLRPAFKDERMHEAHDSPATAETTSP